jgi:hypothetical protein
MLTVGTLMRLVFGLLSVLLCVGVSAADEIPAQGKGLQAVAIVFRYAYNLRYEDVELYTASGPWSEARIRTNQHEDLFLQRNANVPCRFDLGFTVEDKEGVPTMGKRVASIWFNKLSRETETSTRQAGLPQYPWILYDFTVFGLPGALCDNVSVRGKDRCFDRLKTGGLELNQLRQLQRALGFVFENVCGPAELPLLER